MFSYLPPEMEYLIWKMYLTRHVLPEIKNSDTVWIKPSDRLISMTNDTGAIQCSLRPKKIYRFNKYICDNTDFERILARGHRKWYYQNLHIHHCLVNPCQRCIDQGFPCIDAYKCSFLVEKLINNWKLSIL